jgi:hypothetical protein
LVWKVCQAKSPQYLTSQILWSAQTIWCLDVMFTHVSTTVRPKHCDPRRIRPKNVPTTWH